MGRAPVGPPEAFARAVAAEIRAEIARQQIATTEVERRAGVSHNYLWKRLSDQAPLNLNDLDDLARALAIEPGVLVARAEESIRQPRDADVIAGRFGDVPAAAKYSLDAAALESPVSHHDEDVSFEEQP